MVGAAPGGGLALKSGTSFATPVVTGVVCLLLSLGIQPYDPAQVTAACSTGLLAQGDDGSLGDVDPNSGGGEVLGFLQASHASPPEPGIIASAARALETPRTRQQAMAPGRNGGGASAVYRARTNAVVPSDDCSCKGGNKRDYIDPISVGGRSPIFALGVLGYDFGTEARRDSFKALMPSMDPNGGFPFFPTPPPKEGPPPARVIPFPPNPYDPIQMVNYLAGYPRPTPPFPTQGGYPKLEPKAFSDEIPPVPKGYPGLEASPWDAGELIWTLNIELTPVYAIRPVGGFTAEVYQRLVQFLDGQTRAPDDVDYVERVSVPGYLSGENITLYSGQVLPVLVPTLRGMFGWNVNTLINVVLDTVKEKQKKLTPQQIKDKGLPSPEEGVNKARDSLRNFLDRIYFDLRNLGQTPEERALNFASTNAFQAAIVFADSASKAMQLDCITTERSPFCRKDSECFDVKFKFFDPENDRRARLVSRFTVDVSDVYPVLVGPFRTWSESGSPCS
jgi:PatG C-terminal